MSEGETTLSHRASEGVFDKMRSVSDDEIKRWVETLADQQRLRHNDLERNQLINQACADLEDIINGHDPEIHNLGHRVWDRLDKLAMSVESRITSALLLEAEKALELLRRWDALIEHQYSGSRDAMNDMTEVAQETAVFLAQVSKA